MNAKLISLLLLSGVLVFSGCKKEGCTDPAAINYDKNADTDDGSCEYDTTSTVPFEFISLIAEHDSITAGSSTNITATATGTGLKYSWQSVNGEGDIIGSGNLITFASGPCMLGDYEIKCTIEDYKGESDTKSVIIHVYL
ncbi:MAG: hypothetical protein Kow0068_16310 [Marinilabiliales bacterium]